MEFTDLKTQYRALQGEIDARMRRVLEHGQYILGPEVRELEEKLASYTRAKHCITVASGTEALLIALMALDIKPGDEVITTPFTFVATAEMMVLLGAKPVFVDVEEETANIDAARIETAITPRTRAIMPVALYGQPADMDGINAVATRHGIPVIEDAAQSFGATYKGRRSCALSAIGCTSFFPSKPLGCYGDGGAMFTDDAALAQAMREIRVHGQSGRYHHTRIGIAGRMDTLQCAIVLAKLDAFEQEIIARHAAAERYSQMLAPHAERIAVIGPKAHQSSVYAQFTVRVRNREHVQKILKADGIPTAVHYPAPIHRQPAYVPWSAGADCPVAERLAKEVLSLPMHAYLDEATQSRIAAALARATA